MSGHMPVLVRETRPEDFDAIVRLSARIYRDARPWSHAQLQSHHDVFPQGQFVAVEPATGRIVGMAASLIVYWDDYVAQDSWRDFTSGGMFSNHDAIKGRTLYGAEVMADPALQGRGIGSALYVARRELAVRRGLLRIRAGARLRGYGAVADRVPVRDYVLQVIRGERTDPTLTFQLRRGFHVIDVVGGYLHHDSESLGYAATIQWLNPAIARPDDCGAAIPMLEPYVPIVGGERLATRGTRDE